MKPQKYISVFNKPTRQQLLTPAICNWIIVARNRLHVAWNSRDQQRSHFSNARHCGYSSNEWPMKFTTFWSISIILFEEFLSPRIFPNGLESATFESVIFALLPFLEYNSIHTISMQNNIKIKLTYIARWLVHRKSQQQLLYPIVFSPSWTAHSK